MTKEERRQEMATTRENLLDTIRRRAKPTAEVLENSLIYFLVHNGDVVYVGQSIRGVQGRIKAHSKNYKFDSVFTIPTPREGLNGTERYYIKMFNPCFNTVHNDRVADAEDFYESGEEMAASCQGQATYIGLDIQGKECYEFTTPEGKRMIAILQSSDAVGDVEFMEYPTDPIVLAGIRWAPSQRMIDQWAKEEVLETV